MRSLVSRAASAARTMLTLTMLLTSAHSASAAPAQIRPIEDWLATQGTFCLDDGAGGCVLFVPPVENYLGWGSSAARPPVYFASIDYAGLANEWLMSQGHADLGTTLNGFVRERPLNTGATEVTVSLHVRNALSWANECCDFSSGTLLFGARATDVAAGATPALGDGELAFTFVHDEPPGAPLPDMLQVLFSPAPGQRIRTLSFRGQATGVLHAAFGVADGTPGRLGITQTGIFHSGFHGSVGDGFPAEMVELRAIGGGAGALSGAVSPGSGTLAAVAPNPLRVGGSAAITYRVPDGGAWVDVDVYTAAGRRVIGAARGFEPAGIHTMQWAGLNEVGTRLGAGLYFVRVSVGDTVHKMSLVLLD